MESEKNREKGRRRRKKKLLLFVCFRPVAMDDGAVNDDRRDCFADPVFKNIAVRENKEGDGLMIPAILSSFSDESSKVSGEDGVAAGRRRKKYKFSKIFKTLFFETSLAKKIKNRRAGKNSFRSNSNTSTKGDKFSNPLDEKLMPRESSEDNAPSSLHNLTLTASSSLCSSCSSSRALNLSSLSGKKALFGSNSFQLKQSNDGSNYSLCLLLVSLLVLIFWGRICAILCTSTWLFFVPHRSIRRGLSAKGVELMPEVDSVEYKKRIVMKGLLKRNRARML